MFRFFLTFIRWLLHLKGYQFLVLTNHEDIAKSNALRNEVFLGELNWHQSDDKDHSSLFDELENISQLIACRTKKGEIIASVRITPGAYLLEERFKAYFNEFSLHLFPEWLIKRTDLITRFCIKKPYRKSFISFFIVEKVMNHLLSHHAVVGLGYCLPTLYPLYKKMGFQAYTKIKKIHGKFLCYLYQDILMLKENAYFPHHDINLKQLTKSEIIWLKQFHNVMSSLPPNISALTDVSNLSTDLFKGISSQGIKELFNNHVVISYQQEEILAKLTEQDHSIGIIKDGAIKVEIGNQYITTLQKNEIFGEVSYLLRKGRTAQLTAVTDSEVIFLSKNFPDKLSSVEDKIILWKNWSYILANRLSVSNAKLSHAISLN